MSIGCQPIGVFRVTIRMDLPRFELSPNARVHWAVKAKVTAAYKSEAIIMGRRAMRPGMPWKKASAKLHFYFKTKRSRDHDNFIGMMKPAFDGLVRAKVIVDDRSDYLSIEKPEFHIDKDSPRVDIILTRLE
jgi:Holliday junction resolvase RusA-like endonuclease